MRIKHSLAAFAAPILLLLIAFSAQAKTDLIYVGNMMTEEPDYPSRHPPAAAPQIGPGAVITVTTTDTAVNPGDTFCSLIEALENANADSDASGGDCPAGAGPDTIELGMGEVYTLTAVYSTTTFGPNGLPTITSTIALNGHGSTIVRSTAGATPEFRILFIGGGNLMLSEATVSNGLVDGFSGGGILNQDGTLTLNNSAVRDNEAINASGGGIASRAVSTDATTTINDSDILSNTAETSGGGLYLVGGSNLTATLVVSNSQVSYNHANADAGGIRSTRFSGSTNHLIQVNILGSEVSHNTAAAYPGGGGMIINYSEMLLADSLVSDNRVEVGAVSVVGGGIVNGFSDITILRSTIRDNVVASAGGPFQSGGGGVFNTDGTMLIVNSTIGGNQANLTASGGALLVGNHFGNSPSIVTIINSTINGNSTDTSAGAVATLDLGTGQPVVINFSNTIVSNNPAPDSTNCVAAPGTTISSTGYNLEDLDTCNFNQPTDLINTNPLLGLLQDNGGPTWTYALLDGSPAIDAADNAVCAAPPVNGVDQRGVARPYGPSCDIGAFELEYVDFKIFLPIVLK